MKIKIENINETKYFSVDLISENRDNEQYVLDEDTLQDLFKEQDMHWPFVKPRNIVRITPEGLLKPLAISILRHLYRLANDCYYSVNEEAKWVDDWLLDEPTMHNGISSDPVQHPSHYNLPSGRESKDVIKDFLGTEEFNHWAIGNALKYLARYEHKGNPVQDLNKAREYIQMVIDNYGKLPEEEVSNDNNFR